MDNAGMGGRGSIRVVLEVDPEIEPIQGDVRTERGERVAFQGWMELTSAIEEARTDARAAHRIGEGA
jgi:hypothetical protein